MSPFHKIVLGSLFGIVLLGFLLLRGDRRWGFSPWDGAPRIEFGSELECWQWLSRGKESNLGLRYASCTLGEPGPSWAEDLWRIATRDL